MTVQWLTAFIDVPFAQAAAVTDFWLALTETTLSTRRGDHDQFATFLPTDGDAFLRVQHVDDERNAHHLDLHVDDVAATRDLAVRLGAAVTTVHENLVLVTSPGGHRSCLVRWHGESRRPRPTRVAGGDAQVLVDQYTFDVPAPAFADEVAYWSALTGWAPHTGSRSEFTALTRPEGMPLRLLLQRLDDSEHETVEAHLDLACDDVAGTARAHVALGAQIVAEHANWTTLADPSGRRYCLTRRDPRTGLLPVD